MVWVALDDKAMTHPKQLRAGVEGVALWVAGLCHCNAHNTNGRVDKDLVPMLFPPLGSKAMKAAKRLVEVKLWDDCGDHYLVHDYEHFQAEALKDVVESKRSAARERKRSQRMRDRGNPEMVSTCTYCSRFINEDSVSWDHIHPVSRGGKDASENIVPACEQCNSQKGDKTIDEWFEWRTKRRLTRLNDPRVTSDLRPNPEPRSRVSVNENGSADMSDSPARVPTRNPDPTRPDQESESALAELVVRPSVRLGNIYKNLHDAELEGVRNPRLYDEQRISSSDYKHFRRLYELTQAESKRTGAGERVVFEAAARAFLRDDSQRKKGLKLAFFADDFHLYVDRSDIEAAS